MENVIVLYPAPGVGHLISMVELGKLILTGFQSLLSITIIIPSFPFSLHSNVLSYIASVSSSFPSISFLSLPPISLLHGDPSNYTDPESILYESLHSNNPNVLTTLQSITQSCNVCAFIIDFFCYASLEISCSLEIPTYFYFPSGASALSLFLNFPVFDKIATDSFRNLDMSFEIPTLFSVHSSQMLEPMLDREGSYYEFVKMGAQLAKSDGIIVNTFEALESRVVKSLNEGTCLPGTVIPPVYCIGPLVAKTGEKGGEKHECLSWLDSQPSKSVVFLCFGSKGLFSKEQLCEIAIGLERSRVRFLWVVRDPPDPNKSAFKKFEISSELDLGSILPNGFLERTKDIGLVVKSWAPQVDVLAHDSVGGFVSHCGWNSTLETVCAGVPMVAWPIYAEQRFNKIVLVNEIRIAIPMDESESRFVSSDEVEKRVKQIMCSEEGDDLRKRVLELRDESKSVFDEGGSSNIMLSKLVDSWKLKR